MVKRALAIVLVLAFTMSLVSGCAWLCKNGPEVTTNLSNTVTQLKILVDQLKAALLAGYDAEIELAYMAAKGSLAAAQTLLAQSCPDPAKVTEVVNSAEKVSIPQATAAVKKAKRLKFIQ